MQYSMYTLCIGIDGDINFLHETVTNMQANLAWLLQQFANPHALFVYPLLCMNEIVWVWDTNKIKDADTDT